jgi:predicted MFS family arabinose efflux permease
MGFGFVFGSIGLVVMVLARSRGASAGQLGIMFAITSVGGVVGALAAPRILRRLRPYTCIVAFSWIATAATLSMTMLQSPYSLGVAGAVAFFFVPPLNALAFGLVAEQAPDALQGRVTSAAIQLASLAAPVGPALAGATVTAVGPVSAVTIYGCGLGGLACIASLSRALRTH